MDTAIELEMPDTQSESATMGKVLVEVELINPFDDEKCEAGLISASQVRRLTIETLVDTGCTLLCIPEEAIQKLGLRLFREKQSRFANGQTATRKIYGPVEIRVMGRSDSVLAMAGHPGMPALLGQIPLEGLDLMVDSKRQRLVPGHPDFPEGLIEVY